jgi:hypothetical protein
VNLQSTPRTGPSRGSMTNKVQLGRITKKSIFLADVLVAEVASTNTKYSNHWRSGTGLPAGSGVLTDESIPTFV